MQKATRSILLMSVAAVFALGQLTGCAVEPAAPETAEPPVAEDASALLAQADEAFQAGRLERAQDLYTQLMEKWAQALQPEQRQTVGTRLGRIKSMLHQRSLEEGEAEAAEHPAPAEEAAAEEAPAQMAEEEPPQPAEQPAPEAGEEEEEPPAEPEPEPIPEIAMSQVPAVLGRVESLAAEGQFDQLAPQLLGLDRLRDEFSAERKLRFDRLRLEVERASDALPELPKREKVRRAEEHLAIGLEARDQMDYVRAAPHLELAAAYDVSLGWWDNRKLRRARSDVEADLQELKAALEAGRAAYKAGRWPEARRNLQEVAETEIVLPEELHAEVQQMLREIEREESEQAARQLAAAQEEAELLEARAQKINDIYSAAQTRLEQAAGAMELGNYEEAESLLAEAQQMLQDPVAQEAPALAQTRTVVRDRLAEVRQLAEQKAQRETVSRQMEELFGQAAELVAFDLRAAQQKVHQAEKLAAQHQTPLTEGQQRVRQRVLEALEDEYGLERSLVRQESLRLLQAVEHYEARGEHGRALKLISLVRGADPVLLAEDVRQEAEAAAAELRPRAAGQQATARQLVAMYSRPARLAAQGETQDAIQARDEILARARKADLAGEPMLQLARRDMEFVRDQLAPTIETAGPDYEQLVAEQARTARHSLDLVMARYYLDRSPQMAAPFLEAVGERGGETGAWAKSALETLKQRQEAAEQDELLAVQDQLTAVRAAAERLHELSAQGQMEAARRAEQELADARLTLQMEKAELALARGDWERADRMLEAAPAGQRGACGRAVPAVARPRERRRERGCRTRRGTAGTG